MSIWRYPEGRVAVGSTINIICTREAAKPSPRLVLKEDGRILAGTYANEIVYKDINCDKLHNLMNYTCEATGGEIAGVMTSPTLTIHLMCNYLVNITKQSRGSVTF